MSRVERTVFHMFVYTVGNVLNRGAAYMLLPVYAHLLSPKEIAIWDLCAVTVLFLYPIFDLGMGSALMRSHPDTDDEATHKRHFSSAYNFSLLAWTIAGGVLIYFAGPIAELILNDSSLRGLIVLTVLVTIMTAAGSPPLAILRAKEQSITYSLVNLARAVVGPSTIILLVVVLGQRVEGILWGELAGLGAAAVLGLALQRKYWGPIIDRRYVREALAFGLPIIPVALASSITLMSDRYFLTRMIGQEDMAVYAIAFRVSMVIGVIVRAFQTGWLASALIVAKEEHAAEAFAKFFRWFTAGMMLMALSLAAVSPELIALITPGEMYRAGYRIVPWITLSYATYAAVVYVTISVVITRKTYYATLIYGAGAALKIGLNFALIPLFLEGSGNVAVWAGVGAGIATLIAYGVKLCMAFYITERVYPIPYRYGRIASMLLLAILCSAVITLHGALPYWWGVAARGGMLAVFAGALVPLGIVPMAEWRELRVRVGARIDQVRRRRDRSREMGE